jgi:branched-subunit amino acid aminotransferase/4-amino-4-deoxychorismate lyase
MIFNYAIFNGELLPVDQARISVFNPAILSGFGVYETVKVDQGRPFYLEEHLHRLLESARSLDLGLDVQPDTLLTWFKKLLAVDPQATWSLRIIALGAIEPGAAPVIALQSTPLPVYPPDFYQYGAVAILYEGRRVMPKCKSLNTLINYLARREATRLGALEGLLHHDGYMTEGSRSNLFAVRQGQLITPPTAAVLSGITRDIILQVMQETDQPVVETDLPADISLYQEVFISSTSLHVMPITKIDGRAVGDGQVGPVTKKAMARFEVHYRQVMENSFQKRLG